MYGAIQQHLAGQLDEIRAAGLFKGERVLSTPQQAHVGVRGRAEVLNMCANNYLGLANHPEVVRAAHEALDHWGNGLASVRFICGTQELHKALERAISEFLGTEDTILYSSCWDANGGLFETILGPEDAVISDELNHASIIDGIRLCKARRLRYKNNDMADLEAKLQEARDARFRLIATDGVFSMDGIIADLKSVCDLAEKYDAIVMVDDSHAVGFLGKHGRGTHEYRDVMGRVDIVTGTLGKALGGASGGYTSARAEIVTLLRQRSRPYLFSNSVAPPILGASLKALEICGRSTEFRDRLEANTQFFRAAMTDRRFQIVPGEHPITPIMIGDAALAGKMADRLLENGVYASGFSFPVVPQGKARVRVQVSAAHTRDDLEFAIDAFTKVRDELGL
jgi:glycine C-acetyltransferase